MSGQTADELKAEGNSFYAQGNDEAALDCYQRALALVKSQAPNNGSASSAAAAAPDTDAPSLEAVLLSNASAAAARLGQAGEARKYADRAVARQPAWAKAYLRQAVAAELQHRPGDAERALRAGLKACSDKAKLQAELDRLLRVRCGHRSPALLPGVGCSPRTQPITLALTLW
jgi:tetratricopeptide (TPR) repeat protein